MVGPAEASECPALTPPALPSQTNVLQCGPASPRSALLPGQTAHPHRSFPRAPSLPLWPGHFVKTWAISGNRKSIRGAQHVPAGARRSLRLDHQGVSAQHQPLPGTPSFHSSPRRGESFCHCGKGVTGQGRHPWTSPDWGRKRAS